MEKKFKVHNSIVSFLLAVVMCFSLLPTWAFADMDATPKESSLSAAAQNFIAAVDTLDRDAILSAANAWGLAHQAWEQDPTNEDLKEALNQAINAQDEATVPLDEAEELYALISKEEQSNEAVVRAYSAWGALVVAMYNTMDYPTPPTSNEPSEIMPIEPKDALAELYNDLPDAPTGSYIGSMGLPIATGETKISISEWKYDLYTSQNSTRLDADALNSDDLTVTIGTETGKDYVIIPIVVQVEYPANGSSATVLLPEGVDVLSFSYTDDEYCIAGKEERDSTLHYTYEETSAAASGFFVTAQQNFTATFLYTAPDGAQLTKTLHVRVLQEENLTPALWSTRGSVYAVDGPAPPYSTGKITSIAKVGGTWLVWFNGTEAYCCSHGLNGQPNGCPTYNFSYTSMLEPGQYQPGQHYLNQINIWGALNQLRVGLLSEQHSGSIMDSTFSTAARTYSAEEQALLEYCYRYYDDGQMNIIVNYPESQAAQIYLESAKAAMQAEHGTPFASAKGGYYTWMFTPPISDWQLIAVVGPQITDDTVEYVPSAPAEYYATWSAPSQTVNGEFEFSYTVNVQKTQLITEDLVDGAVIEIEPVVKHGEINGGTWAITPADKQTVTTQNGMASSQWTLRYNVSKTSEERTGQVGPYGSQDEADAAAENEKNATIAQLQAQAQGAVNSAISSAKAQLDVLQFTCKETVIPYGFEFYAGTQGSNQTIEVQQGANAIYPIKNEEWHLQVRVDKVDSETKQPIAADALFEVYAWDEVSAQYVPFGDSNPYTVERQPDGTYAVTNHSAYAATAEKALTLYYTQRNKGKFLVVETKAPIGYYGDYTDPTNSGTANTPLGKKAYYIELTKANNGKTFWLSNADHNADISIDYEGGTKLLTGDGVVTTVTINETQSISSDKKHFMNERVQGKIVLHKVDLDALRTLPDGSNGETSLEGAVYDLYAAEDIFHPDGVSGVVNYATITDDNGDPIQETTIRDNTHWVNDYLPILQKDHLVASASIQDGMLAFHNLYLGSYYLVERSTGTVLTMQNGAFIVSGQYPVLNRQLNPAGQSAELAQSNGKYTDWVYKNQYSTTVESRTLDGFKSYDGYYLSFANGYLCDEINHYLSLAYAGEAQQIVTETVTSKDKVLKSGFTLNKLVSTTGQTSPALKLEGAGFTVYRISALSKADQFLQNPDGSYNAQSILDAYRRDAYDNTTPKYDFSDEIQAIVTMYESDSVALAAYNSALTEVGDFAYGKGDGWVTTGNANEYCLAEIFTNAEGKLRVDGLPYGQYLVVETTIPKDVFQADPFVVAVDETTPASAFCTPNGASLTPSGNPLAYNILNEELEGTLQLVKMDAETGKAVQVANTAFSLYLLHENGSETLVTMADPTNGNAWSKTSVFYTDETGYLKTPEKLSLGRYRIVEISGPNGFFNDTAYSVEFELTSERVWQVQGSSANGMDAYVLVERYYNHETLGKLTIQKRGEVLTGITQSGEFVYEERPLSGAEFTITAADDICTQDYQLDENGERTLWYAKGDVVAVVTTGKNGQVDEVYFAPTRTQSTDAFLSVTHDGTLGEVSLTLPLGRYIVAETKAPYGYTLSETLYDVELTWENQTQNVVVWKDVLAYRNEREKSHVTVQKFDSESGISLAGAVFALYTVDDIYSVSGTLLFAAGDLLTTSTPTTEDGIAKFGVDLPIRGEHWDESSEKNITTNSGRYIVREVQPPQGYYQSTEPMELYFTYDGNAQMNLVSICKNKPTEMFVSKRELTNDKELPGATLTITDSTGNTVREWVSTDKPQRITGLHMGEVYTLTETIAADGYALANSIVFRLAQKTDAQGTALDACDVYYLTTKNLLFLSWDDWALLDDSTVVMYDDITKVNISKKDITTNKELPGAELVLLDANGNEIERWISTTEPHYIEKLPAGIYTLTELTAPDGYLRAESITFTVQATGEVQTIILYNTSAPAPIPISDVPKTGYNTHIKIWAYLLATALLGFVGCIAALMYYKKRNIYRKFYRKNK